MMTPLLPPHASGVYQIRCIPTGKIYVGSAVNLFKRWYDHRRTLRKGEHGNRYLQHAWDKYGEKQFAFEILELVDVSYLLEVEQEWIDSTACVDKSIGFNIRDTAESSGSFTARIWEGFSDPDGKAIIINSVRQREYIKTYQGFIDPDGNLVGAITNLAEFCRQHDLDNTHMVAVMNGRICSHRGWTHVRGRVRQEHKTHTGFVDPGGRRVAITNLAEFCRENGLHPVKMHNLKSGKIQRYKGWTWRED